MAEMTPEAKALRNEYMRQRYAANKEKERERQVAYWNRKAAERAKEK